MLSVTAVGFAQPGPQTSGVSSQTSDTDTAAWAHFGFAFFQQL